MQESGRCQESFGTVLVNIVTLEERMQRALNREKAMQSRCGQADTLLTVFEHSNQEGLIRLLIPPICGDLGVERLRYPHISVTVKTTICVIVKTNTNI